MEEFDAQKTPNKKLLEELFPTTNGQTYARRFVVVREKDGKFIPIEYKDLHFEIASVGIGKTVIPADQVSNYVTITEKTTTNGVLQSANMFVNRGQSVETMDIRIRAFTSSGAEAYYRFQVNDKPISYTTYYKNQKIDYDGFSVASDGASEINLNENVDVRVGENPQQPVSPNEYKFYLIVHEKLGTDYSQFITLSGGIIQISTLVNDVETTVVIYNNKGEISRFNLVLKCTIDHEIISTTVNNEGIFDIGNSVDFFNATSADGNYSMQEITTRVYVRNYLNETDIGSTSANNLFVNVGGYSIKDISKRYNQYVLIDNLKVYAENLMDTWKGKFYLGDDAKYDVLTEGEKRYIRYNGSVIEVENNVVKIPLQSITDGDTVAYEVGTEAKYVIIPHLKFSNGNDTRDYVLYDRVFHEEETDPATKYTNEPFDINRKGNYTTYVNAYVNGYIRYKVDKVENSDGTTELKAAILRLTHNNVQYVAQVDKEHFDHEYITIDNEKHYFTRFYTISYDGIAANAKDTEGNDVLNVPKVRYMLGKDETTIDLSKIIFYTQEEISNNVLKLGGTNYISNMFKFYVDDGSEESSEIEFSKDDAGNNTLKISRESNNKFSPINIMIKDTTGKYVVGRLTILPTVETSTSEKESNKTIFIEAGDTTKVDYAINSDTLGTDPYKDAMSEYNGKPFTGKIETDHSGWTNYVYAVSSNKYTNLLSIDDNGQISGLSGQAPWGDVTVEAKLRYSSSNKSLTTTIKYSDWKNAFFGNNVFNDYNDLKNALNAQRVTINLSENINNGNAVNGVKLDENGNITNVAFGSTVTLVFKQKCEKCNDKITLGETHDCWFAVGTEVITDISIFTDEQIQSLESVGSFEEIDGSDEGKKYVYTLQLQGGQVGLQKSKDGVWTLDGEVIKTTQQKHSFTAKFVYEEQTNGDLPVELLEEAKDPDAGEEQPTTYGKTVSETELQPVYENLGFASFEEFKSAIISLSTTSGTVAFVENGIAIAGATEQTVTLSYILNLPRQLGTQTSSFEIESLEINDKGYLALAKALFGEEATTILGYANWDALLADCDVEFAGYDKDAKTFGGQKEINITLTTTQAKHTGTFYIVNQEHDNKTIHGVGNLKKIDESLNDYTAAKEIASVVNVGTAETPIWVYPMKTHKYLSNDAKKELFDNVKIWWGVESSTNGWSTSDLFTDERKGLLETAAEILDEKDSNSNPTNRDPFNTATIYQHGYAIGNIHIYLEDYHGDKSYSKFAAPLQTFEESEIKGTYGVYVEGENGETSWTQEGEASLHFEISKDNKLTTYIVANNETYYLTSNANMDNNRYLFDNGLLLFINPIGDIKLQLIAKYTEGPMTGKFEFVIKDFAFRFSVDNMISSSTLSSSLYFEGLKDRVEQPTNSKIEEGIKTYKAEKTGDVVGYKDKIEKDMFNFDKWEYSASYVNENGKTIQAIIDGKSIKIVGLSKTNTQLKITVSGISEEGGDYTFVVDLNQNPAVTIIGGNESITSPDTPFDGGVLTGGQEKIVNLGEIFEINAKESPVEIKNYEGNTDDDSLLQVLYDNLYLYYLVGKLDGYSSNVFKITKDENSGQNIISIIFTGAEEQEFTIVKDADGKFSLIDKEGNPVDGNFVLELNTDLYEFSAEIIDRTEENGSTGDNGNSPEGGTTPTNEGDSGSGGSSAEGVEQPQPTPIKVLKITITPVFTYKYQVESNIKLINIVDTDFATTGELKVVGGEIKTESVVKLRFSVLRGKGADAKEVAFAYYSLSLKPSIGAVVSYPTISTSTKDENGNFVAVGQTTEYFNAADAGEFDINAKSTISSGEASRMVITKYAYGTATDSNGKTTSCIVTYEGAEIDLTIIKIGKESVKSTENKTLENNVLTATVTTEKETKYTISVYVPNLTISYTASSNQNIIIKGKDESGKNILTNSLESEGKFTFDMTGVTVSEAEVVVSAQATVTLGNAKDGVASKSYTYTFAQYTFTVCKNPVISTLVTTDPTHLDGNGAEILPINGGDSIKPFDISSQDSYGYVGGVPRLQFVYNNLILSSDYYGSFQIKDKTKVNKYQILQTATGEGTVYFVFNTQSVSGSYSYKTVWDYRMNPTLDSHTIMGNYDPENTSELLNYYYLNAGKAYNIIETFGLTKYFSTESLTEIFNLGFADSETAAAGYEGVKFTADGKSINILGAPEGGMNFRIQFKPYRSAEFKTIGITILPSIEIVVNYRTETIYENDPYAYGLISYNQVKNNEAYPLISNAKGTDFTIQRNGVTADVVEGEYTLEIVEGTDETLNAKIEHSGSSATLTIANPPKLNAKRVVIKISDKYGYYQYLRYVVGAETQVVISSNDITFTTGGNIEWESNQFPISFKKSGEETIQLASFYTAQITDATSKNTSDNYGSDSSLKIDTDGNLYGVQLDSVITKKNLVKNNGNDYSNWTYVQKKSDNTFFTDTKYEVEETKDSKKYKYSYSITRNEIGKLTKITRTITQGQTKIAEDSIKKATDGVWKFVDKDTTGKEIEGSYDQRFVLTEIRNDVYYIPYNGKTPISYDVYKLIAKSGDNDKILKSFSNYKKQIVKYGTESWDSTNPNGVAVIGDAGVFNPQIKTAATEGTPAEYYLDYVIELYSSQNPNDKNPDATMTFKIIEVDGSDNLYYASRKNPTDHYAFDYEIKINGEGDSIVKGKNIKNIGNAQYGSASSLNTTLKITIKDSNGDKLDYVDIGILLKFGIYPEVKQTVAGQISYDYVGHGDSIQTVLTNKTSNIALKSSQASFVAPDKKYSTVLGKTPTTSLSGTASKMDSRTLTSYDYDSSTRVLSLKATLNNDNKAEINNILYTYGSTKKTLTIGYRVVTLTDGKFVDDVTGITYQVKEDSTLYVSKKIDNANTVTINNIKYTVETSSGTQTVKYETLYERIFVVWKYDGNTYWTQWNYKVVDKFNQVTTGDPLEAQDGNIKVKLDWVSGDYRFNANTLELWKKGKAKPLGTAQWVSELSGNRYEIEIGDATYKIVVGEDDKMKFEFISGTEDTNITGLALEEETTKNSSWADKITLTGLDGELTSLRVANGMTRRDGKPLITINGGNNLEISDSYGLLSKTINVTITYKDSIEGVDKSLKFNGNEIKVTFEHFDPTKNQQSA